MFKTAATKIAHNSTLPALSGNQELRPLQDLIAAEKAVLLSLQKLSADFSKAAEALRTWGLCEGDDLGDILSASTTVLNHFSNAVSQYAVHGHAIREHLKVIRSREEILEEMKRRRRAVFKKADDADKKLNKMSPEHKNLQMQVDLLNRLRDEIRTLDSDILVEEAALGDFKRTATRMWMGLKFGGLMECCQKGQIVAAFGEAIISEISEAQTQPGLHRAFYHGQAKTEAIVANSHRAVHEVPLSTISSIGFRDRREYYGGRDSGSSPSLVDKPVPSLPRESSELYGPLSRPYVNLTPIPDSPNSLFHKPSPWSQSQNDEHLPSSRPFATGVPAPASLGHGSQKGSPWSSNHEPPYAAGVPAPASLGHGSHKGRPWSPGYEPHARRSSLDDSGRNHLTTMNSSIPDRDTSGSRFAPVNSRSPPPSFPPPSLLDPQSDHGLGPSLASSIAEALGHSDDSLENNTLLSDPTTSARSRSVLPAASDANPWVEPAQDLRTSGKKQRSETMDTQAAVLAYMMSADDEAEFDEPRGASFRGPSPLPSPPAVEDGIGKSRIGNLMEINWDSDRRSSFEKTGPSRPAPVIVSEGSRPIVISDDHRVYGDDHTGGLLASETSIRTAVEYFPSPQNAEDRERQSNAEAAREISRELEALNAQSEELSLRSPSSPEPTIERGRLHDDYEEVSREPSPLAPPSAPFAKRSVSPHPYPEVQAMLSQPPQGASLPYGQPYGPSSASQSVRFQLPSFSANPGHQTSRLPSGSSPLSVSMTSPPSNSPSINPAGMATSNKTISAAAFKRPRNKSVDNRESVAADGPKGFPNDSFSRVPSGTYLPVGGVGSMRVPPPTDNNLMSPASPASDFDLDAYMSHSAPMTPQAEFSHTVSGGYGTSRFSTDLEGDLR